MGYPKFEVSDLGNGLFEVKVDGERTHKVLVESKGSKSYEFLIDETGITQTCYGHPVLERQGPDVPPAAVISIIKGSKGLNIPWSTYWRNGARKLR